MMLLLMRVIWAIIWVYIVKKSTDYDYDIFELSIVVWACFVLRPVIIGIKILYYILDKLKK